MTVFYDYTTFYALEKKDSKARRNSMSKKDRCQLRHKFKDTEHFYEAMQKYLLSQRAAVLNPQEVHVLSCDEDIITHEREWYKCNQRYYCLYPEVIDPLIKTQMDISCEHLRIPQPCYMIRLPITSPPQLCTRVHDHQAVVRTVLVRFIGTKTVQTVIYTHLFDVSDTECKCSRGYQVYFARFLLDSRKTLQEVFLDSDSHTKIALETESIYGTGSCLSADIVEKVYRLFVGTNFLATGAHKLLEYDVLAKHLEAYRKLKENSLERKKYEQAAQKIGRYGYNIGRNINCPLHLPNGVNNNRVVSTGKGRERKHKHIRGGHFRWQRYGKKRSKIRLIYIEPMVIRCDLDFKPLSS